MKKSIVLAGGCFWGVEELFRNLEGVLNTEVGYTGGTTENPSYETVKNGDTGHAESILIEFDPQKINLAEILDFFFKIHDPTTLNQQGNDRGSQYRSAIFFSEPGEEEEAKSAIARAQESGRWSKPIVTQVESLKKFYSAEEYHQDYLKKNPQGYTCHWIRD